MNPPQIPILIMDGSLIISGDTRMIFKDNGAADAFAYTSVASTERAQTRVRLESVEVFFIEDSGALQPEAVWPNPGNLSGTVTLNLNGNRQLDIVYNSGAETLDFRPSNFPVKGAASSWVRVQRSLQIQSVTLPAGPPINNPHGNQSTLVIKLNLIAV